MTKKVVQNQGDTYNYESLNKKVDGIIQTVFSYMNNPNKDYIKKQIYSAYEYAKEAHAGQMRLSGDPYIVHPVEATEILVDLRVDIHTIQACLLHDVIEDTPRTEDDIRENFGDEVAFLCVGLEKLSKVRYKGEERTIGSLRKMFVAMAEDLRVILVKLSDRLHNMRTLKFHPKKHKRERIALETLNIYSPIADRLGLYHIKNNLDEECFKILKPKEYKHLKKQLSVLKKEKKDFLAHIKKEINGLLVKHIKGYEIDYRVKSTYSVYKKLHKKGLSDPKDLFDLFGIRIMVHTEEECYRILGLIHSKWVPIPKRFKDYIALPKPNGYRSLHTTIIGLLKKFRKQPTDIQIKTYEMKEFSDIGVASHFIYKEGLEKSTADIDWVKELKDLTQNLDDKDFVGSLKLDTFRDRIFVFTPKGDLVDLPSGSTGIDFAYYLHTDLGNHVSLVKVNNTIYPLDKELHNGDIVEIFTDKSRKPSPFWMGFVKTLKARNNIKLSLKKENKDIYRERGRDIMNKYLEKSLGKGFDKDLSYLSVLDSRSYNIEERWGLLEQVGNFSITPSSLLKRILKTQIATQKSNVRKEDPQKSIDNFDKSTQSKPDIVIGGEENIAYNLCRCCRRKVTKEIVAHINQKGAITVHKRNCPIIKGVNKDRLLFAYIKGTEEDTTIVSITFHFSNKRGILRDLSEIIYIMDIDIEEIITKKSSSNEVYIHLKLILLDYEHLIIDRLVDRIKHHFGEKLLDSHFQSIKK